MDHIKIKVTKTDQRHKGHDLFSYYVTPDSIYTYILNTSKSFRFNEWRIWAWETWGPSAERDSSFVRTIELADKDRPVWAWHTENGQLRLYLRTEKELNWFKLKWM